MIVSFGGKMPRDEGAAFVAPNATLIGDVVLKPGATIWYGAVLRGDDGTLTVGEGSNVQDNAVLRRPMEVTIPCKQTLSSAAGSRWC